MNSNEPKRDPTAARQRQGRRHQPAFRTTIVPCYAAVCLRCKRSGRMARTDTLAFLCAEADGWFMFKVGNVWNLGGLCPCCSALADPQVREFKRARRAADPIPSTPTQAK